MLELIGLFYFLEYRYCSMLGRKDCLMLEKRGVWNVEEKDRLMLEKSVRMDVGAYRIDVFLRISLQLDVGKNE